MKFKIWMVFIFNLFLYIVKRKKIRLRVGIRQVSMAFIIWATHMIQWY